MFKRYQKTVGDVVNTGELDIYFELFCDECFSVFKGRRRQMCVNALQGVLLVHGHQLKTLLPCSRRALSAWGKHVPTKSALPLPQHWVDVIAVCGILRGYGVLSLGLVIAFKSYLRVGELCRLRGSDILVDVLASSGSAGCGLRIRVAKTGRNQFARVRDPSVIGILRFLKARTAGEELVFQGATPRIFNGLLKLLCQQLGLVQHFTMHSLRHGRASKGHLDREMPEHIRLDGRWASAKSMETYLQAATSLLQTLLLSLGLVIASANIVVSSNVSRINCVWSRIPLPFGSVMPWYASSSLECYLIDCLFGATAEVFKASDL